MRIERHHSAMDQRCHTEEGGFLLYCSASLDFTDNVRCRAIQNKLLLNLVLDFSLLDPTASAFMALGLILIRYASDPITSKLKFFSQI